MGVVVRQGKRGDSRFPFDTVRSQFWRNGRSQRSPYEGHQHEAVPQLRPRVLLAWLIHIPALPSEPGAGWGDASHFKQPSPEGSDLPSPESLRREKWEFEGRKIGLVFIFSQSLRK